MYMRREFETTLEAIRYIRKKNVKIVYLASKSGKCELVWKG